MTTIELPSEQAFLDLISDIYAMVASPSDMSQAFDKVADFFGARGLLVGPLGPTNPENGPVVAYASAVFHDAVPKYLQHFLAINPRRSWLIRNSQSDVVFTDLDFMDQTEIDRHPFYAEFLKPHGNLYCLDRLSTRGNGTKYWISAQFAATADSPGPEAKVLFRRVTDHLLQAMDLILQVSSAPAKVIDLVDRFDGPACAISASGRILYRNPEAESFADPRLSLSGGHLSSPFSRDSRSLEDLLRRAICPMGTNLAHNMVSLIGDGSLVPLLIKASPLPPPDHGCNLPDFFDDVPRVLVHVHTAQPAKRPSITQPLALLGLTFAEARVVDLVASGLTAEAAAQVIGVAPSTVRFQLRCAYEKLNIRKQTDLVQLVNRLVRLGLL